MYAIYVLKNGRIGSATYPQYAANAVKNVYNQEDMMEGYILVDQLPNGSLTDYRYCDGEYIYDPVADEKMATKLDMIEAQVTYTAMMTGTLLEG